MNRNRTVYFKKSKERFFGILVYFMTSIFPMLVQAQDTKPITLKEAINLSIKNSKQLQASAARNEEAAGVLKEAGTTNFPT